MTELIYFSLYEQSDPTLEEHGKQIDISYKAKDIIRNKSNKSVIILCIDDEIFISDNKESLEKTLWYHTVIDGSEVKEIHIQEYHSYEAAYEVALTMKEENELCYEPES